jgi:hypothetical protein
LLTSDKLESESKGLLFRHTVGKTLGNGKINEFVISPVNEKVICPVENLNQYVMGAEKMDIELSVGYLFRTLDQINTGLNRLPDHLQKTVK